MSEPADAPSRAAAAVAEGVPSEAGERPSPLDRRQSFAAVRARVPELELLVSGAVLFALVQISQLVDAAFFRLVLNLGGALLQGLIIAHEYVKLILYTLIVAFVTHLGLRAWWVGLVGIEAAFPAGPRWDRLPRYGPATLEVYRQRLPRLRRMMVATETLASVVFATGLAFAGLFAFSIVGVLLFGGLALLVHAVLPGVSVSAAFLAVSLLVALLMTAVGLLDRVRGERLLASPRGARWLRRGVGVTTWLAGARLFGPVTLPVLSNLPRRRVYAGFVAGIGLVVATYLVRDLLLGFGLVGFDSHRYLGARPPAGGFEPAYYETYRAPGGMVWRLPSLAEDVASGPYLRLFVPFTPERVEEAVDAHCPGLVPRGEPGLRLLRRHGDPGAPPAEAAALRACLLRSTRVELDGRPLPVERFALGVHPRSGARGLMAQLPVSELAPGEHRVTVLEGRRRGDERPPRRHVIPFWR